ncbi:MAG: DUF2791 family P-loop domain-containing protein [Methylococcales bacterium]|nr:DUF2791 family P-loop domain-containing protein [Methylococcales bacterium]MBT7408375.1 DUF2791 family P-loop domain-containing protein [Methylococcales bacterium]
MTHKSIANYPVFKCRQAVERLREGLFDPLAVQCLTVQEQRFNQTLQQIWQSFSNNKPTSLSICGAYGQGKSHHLTYCHEQALQQGFASSFINLDPREIPFQQFHQVYRALVSNIVFSEHDHSLSKYWQKWIKQHIETTEPEQIEAQILQLLPNIPHLLKCLLIALAQNTERLTAKQKLQKKHKNFRPREFPYLLEKALLGEVIPVLKLRHALKYRHCSIIRQASLTCKKPHDWLLMLQGIAQLIKLMGLKGWVLLFDEGESIAQLRLPARHRSYQLLQHFFKPDHFQPILPVFAFTDHFFQTLENEDYEKIKTVQQQEQLYFSENYANSWKNIKQYQLQDLSQDEWQQLIVKLVELYQHAYQFQQTDSVKIIALLQQQLSHNDGIETRFRLKALVNELDLYFQK